MEARTSLRDYQRDLAERLRSAQGSANASMLGVQVDDENCFDGHGEPFSWSGK
jgi:hypothetical protein